MARPRRAVIRAAVASNRPAQPRLSVNPQGRGWRNPAGGRTTGVSRGRPARPSAGYGGQGGGGGGAGAPSPSSGLPQSSTAMPWDSGATTTVAGAGRDYADTMGEIASQRDFTLRNIGIGAGYENNPYSQASLLVRQKEIGTRGINQRPGQLYSGATINHLGQVERGYNEGYYNLNQQREADVAKWEQAEQRARDAQQSAQEQAQQEAIERAAESTPEPAPVGGGGPVWKGKGEGTIGPWKKPGKGKKGGK